MTHANDIIRAIARRLVGHAVSDYEITFTAQQAGCNCAVDANLNTLDMLDRFRLLKFLMAQGQAAGLSIEQMARLK